MISCNRSGIRQVSFKRGHGRSGEEMGPQAKAKRNIQDSKSDVCWSCPIEDIDAIPIPPVTFQFVPENLSAFFDSLSGI